MSILKDCCFLYFLLIVISFLLIRCCRLKNEISAQKEFFIKMLGHDLRVPVLAQIRGLDLIRKNSIPDDMCYMLDEVQNSCVYTLDMITMLMKIYSLESGDINLTCETFSACEMYNSILKEYEDILADKSVGVTCNINENTVYANKEAFYKAMKILIYVMLQHSKRNSSLHFSVSNLHDNLNLALSYTGQKLSYGEYNRIFSNSPKFSAVGQGIQMYLFKKIIDLHKGKIELVSENEQKTYTFKISLPGQKKACMRLFPGYIKC